MKSNWVRCRVGLRHSESALTIYYFCHIRLQMIIESRCIRLQPVVRWRMEWRDDYYEVSLNGQRLRTVMVDVLIVIRFDG